MRFLLAFLPRSSAACAAALAMLAGLRAQSAANPPETPFYRITLGPVVPIIKGGVFPYLFQTKDGTLVLQGSLARPAHAPEPERNDFGGIPRTVRSTDGGRSWQTWTPPGDPMAGPLGEGAWVQLRSGATLLFSWIADYQHEGLFTGKRWQSDDDWQTILAPEPTRWNIPGGIGEGADDGGHPYTAICAHRSVLEMPNGDLVTAIYGQMKGDTARSEYMPSMFRFRCMFMRSQDRGRTWNYVATVAADPLIGQEGFNESALVRLKGGEHPARILCVMRVGRRHPLYQAYSDDEGRSWSKARALNLVGVDPDLVELRDGTLACSFGHKPDCNDDGNFLAFSFDQGANWSQVARVSTGLTGAYTTVCELEPGKLLVVYDIRLGSYRSGGREIVGRTVGLTQAQ